MKNIFRLLGVTGAFTALHCGALQFTNLPNQYSSSSLSAVAAGGANVVAVGTNGAIVRLSALGQSINLANESNSFVGSTALAGITYGQGNFVAGGSSSNLFASSVPASWTISPVLRAGTFQVSSLAASGNSIFASLQTLQVFYSTGLFPSIFTNSSALFLDANLNGIASSSPTSVVVVGNQGGANNSIAGAYVAISTSGGTNFSSTVDQTTGGTNLLAVASGALGTIAVGSDGAAWFSTSGNYTFPVRKSVGVTNNLYGVTTNTDGFIAVGDKGLIASSVDGTNWTTTTFGTNNLKAVTYASSGPLVGLTFAVGANGTILVGGDAPTIPTLSTHYLEEIQYAPANSYTVTASGFPSTAFVNWYTYSGGTYTEVLANSPTYTFTNLTQGSTYTVYARAQDSRVPTLVSSNYSLPCQLVVDTLDAVAYTHYSNPHFTNWFSVVYNSGTTNLVPLLDVSTNNTPGSDTNNPFGGAFGPANLISAAGLLNTTNANLNLLTTNPPLPNFVSYTFTNANGTVASSNLPVVVLVPPQASFATSKIYMTNISPAANLNAVLTVISNAPNTWGPYDNYGVFSDTNGVVTAGGSFAPGNPAVWYSDATGFHTNVETYSFTNSYGVATNVQIGVVVYENPSVGVSNTVSPVASNTPPFSVANNFIPQSYASYYTGAYSGVGVDPVTGMFYPSTPGLMFSDATLHTNIVSYAFTNSYFLAASGQIGIVVYKLPAASFAPNVYITDQDGGVTNLQSFLTIISNSPSIKGGVFSGPGVTATGQFDPSSASLLLSTATLKTNMVTYTFTNSYNLAASAQLGIVDYAMPVAIPPPATTNCTTDPAFAVAGLFTVTNNAASGGFVFTSASPALADGIFTPASVLAAVNIINYTFTNSSIVSGTNLSVSGSFNLYANDDCGGAQPTLTIQLVNATNVDLKWFGSFQLQSAPDLGGMGTNWSLVSTGGFNSQNSVIQSNVATNHVFYRLFKN